MPSPRVERNPVNIWHAQRVLEQVAVLVGLKSKCSVEPARLDDAGKVIHPLSATNEQEYDTGRMTQPLGGRQHGVEFMGAAKIPE